MSKFDAEIGGEGCRTAGEGKKGEGNYFGDKLLFIRYCWPK
jgi:hypothetical protein